MYSKDSGRFKRWAPETGPFLMPTHPLSRELVMSVAPAEHQTALLTHADRCDKCSGRAYVLAIIVWSPTFRGNGELYFCGHHFAQHEQALRPMTAVLIDERWQLKEHVTDDKGNR